MVQDRPFKSGTLAKNTPPIKEILGVDRAKRRANQARRTQARAGFSRCCQQLPIAPLRKLLMFRYFGIAIFLLLHGIPTFGFIAPHRCRRINWVGPEITGIATLSTSTNLAKSGGSIISSDSSENGKRTKRKRAASSDGPMYWIDSSDPFLLKSDLGLHANERAKEELSSDSEKQISFTIRGNPRVLIRHRTARGFMYNPSKAAQLKFRDCVLELLPSRYHPTILDDEDDEDGPTPQVLFEENEPLELSITFRTKRPKSHFVNNKPGPGRLKPQSPGKFHITRSDVDNLAKFVMDSLNGLLYVDDKQVISLKVMKVLDCDDLCLGSTDVRINIMKDTPA